MAAEGTLPSDSSPLTFVVGDQAYEVETDVELLDDAEAGILLFYNDKLYTGLGVRSDDRWVMHRYGMQRALPKPEILGKKFRLKIQNRRHIVTIYYSVDNGKKWHKFPTQMEVSGYHHNVAYYFLSLRPAIYVADKGKALR